MAINLAALSPNFNVIGEYGDIYKKAEDDLLVKKTLADAKPGTDADSIRARANALFNTGTERGMAEGIKLHTVATAMEESKRKGLADSLLYQYLTNPAAKGRVSGALEPTPPPTAPVAPAPGTGGETITLPEGTEKPQLAPGAPFPPFPGQAGTPIPSALPPAAVPQSVAPTPPPPPQPPAPPPALMPSTPVPPGQKLSQIPPGTEAGGPPAEAPLGGTGGDAPLTPDIAKMLQAPPQGMGVPSALPPVGSTGQAGFAGPPEPARAPGQGPAPSVPGEAQANAKIQEVLQEMAITPKAAIATRQALAKRFEQAMGDLKWDPKVKQWHMENLDNWTRGERQMGFGEWSALQQVRPEMAKHAMDAAKANYDLGTKAKNTLNTLDIMESIRKNPQFVAGPGAPGYAHALSALGSLRDILSAQGVDVKGWDLTKPMTRAGLIQTYDAMAARLVFEAAGGSFGNQVSNADRDFIVKIMPFLSQTKEGMKMLHEISRDMAQRSVTISNVTRAYMGSKGATATREGLESAIEKHANVNRLYVDAEGNPTEKGKRLEKLFTTPPDTADRGKMSSANIVGAAMRAAPTVVEGARRLFGGGAPAEGPTPITPEHEGKTGTFQGRRFRVEGGQMIFE